MIWKSGKNPAVQNKNDPREVCVLTSMHLSTQLYFHNLRVLHNASPQVRIGLDPDLNLHLLSFILLFHNCIFHVCHFQGSKKDIKFLRCLSSCKAGKDSKTGQYMDDRSDVMQDCQAQCCETYEQCSFKIKIGNSGSGV